MVRKLALLPKPSSSRQFSVDCSTACKDILAPGEQKPTVGTGVFSRKSRQFPVEILKTEREAKPRGVLREQLTHLSNVVRRFGQGNEKRCPEKPLNNAWGGDRIPSSLSLDSPANANSTRRSTTRVRMPRTILSVMGNPAPVRAQVLRVVR
jgi:hypothetical protein